MSGGKGQQSYRDAKTAGMVRNYKYSRAVSRLELNITQEIDVSINQNRKYQKLNLTKYILATLVKSLSERIQELRIQPTDLIASAPQISQTILDKLLENHKYIFEITSKGLNIKKDRELFNKIISDVIPKNIKTQVKHADLQHSQRHVESDKSPTSNNSTHTNPNLSPSNLGILAKVAEEKTFSTSIESSQISSDINTRSTDSPTGSSGSSETKLPEQDTSINTPDNESSVVEVSEDKDDTNQPELYESDDKVSFKLISKPPKKGEIAYRTLVFFLDQLDQGILFYQIRGRDRQKIDLREIKSKEFFLFSNIIQKLNEKNLTLTQEEEKSLMNLELYQQQILKPRIQINEEDARKARVRSRDMEAGGQKKRLLNLRNNWIKKSGGVKSIIAKKALIKAPLVSEYFSLVERLSEHALGNRNRRIYNWSFNGDVASNEEKIINLAGSLNNQSFQDEILQDPSALLRIKKTSLVDRIRDLKLDDDKFEKIIERLKSIEDNILATKDSNRIVDFFTQVTEQLSKTIDKTNNSFKEKKQYLEKSYQHCIKIIEDNIFSTKNFDKIDNFFRKVIVPTNNFDRIDSFYTKTINLLNQEFDKTKDPNLQKNIHNLTSVYIGILQKDKVEENVIATKDLNKIQKFYKIIVNHLVESNIDKVGKTKELRNPQNFDTILYISERKLLNNNNLTATDDAIKKLNKISDFRKNKGRYKVSQLNDIQIRNINNFYGEIKKAIKGQSNPIDIRAIADVEFRFAFFEAILKERGKTTVKKTDFLKAEALKKEVSEPLIPRSRVKHQEKLIAYVKSLQPIYGTRSQTMDEIIHGSISSMLTSDDARKNHKISTTMSLILDVMRPYITDKETQTKPNFKYEFAVTNAYYIAKKVNEFKGNFEKVQIDKIAGEVIQKLKEKLPKDLTKDTEKTLKKYLIKHITNYVGKNCKFTKTDSIFLLHKPEETAKTISDNLFPAQEGIFEKTKPGDKLTLIIKSRGFFSSSEKLWHKSVEPIIRSSCQEHIDNQKRLSSLKDPAADKMVPPTRAPKLQAYVNDPSNVLTSCSRQQSHISRSSNIRVN